ncbi:unnamed protein product [Miscanthus lutarioriparius]|uniref:Flavin-containing monooxygenase n=1 Tax=Miscanthus lutarioriparius TaxID=422564 RepID=A0A811MCY7_9POAL|nr:unnamed protein product [Miscanthus lutarioriparius]
MPRTVAVVGAGLHVAVFEKSGRAGGTWAYDPRADADDPLSRDPGAVHGSLYASLRTDLPCDLMGFSVFAGDARAFPGHREVLAFLDAFSEESGVAARVRLRSEVLRVAPLGQVERWVVAWRGEDSEVEEEVFDAVVVCNGHWPTMEFQFQGKNNLAMLLSAVAGINSWSAKQIHSHNYRTPEPFRDQISSVIPVCHSRELQNVVVVGFSANGIDMGLEISQIAKEVHVADRYSKDRLGKIELYQGWYRYHFPFLDLDGLTVDDNRVGPLYKHVFPPKYAPNLSFVGLPYKTLEQESKWVAAVLSGRGTLPSEEDMMAAVREHYRLMEEAGRPKRHTHTLSPQWAEQVGEPTLEPWKCEMFDRVLGSIFTLEEAYRDRWEQERRQRLWHWCALAIRITTSSIV